MTKFKTMQEVEVVALEAGDYSNGIRIGMAGYVSRIIDSEAGIYYVFFPTLGLGKIITMCESQLKWTRDNLSVAYMTGSFRLKQRGRFKQRVS